MGNEPVGINKDEFLLFAPTLINYEEIQQQAEKLIDYRVGVKTQKSDEEKRKFKDMFRNDFAETFLETSSNEKVKKLLRNLKDYGDNAIRYFRFTRLLHVRGGGFYIDLEPRRLIEITNLLSIDNAAPLKFGSADEYIEYLADLEKPILPWETKQKLEEIADVLDKDIRDHISDLRVRAQEIPTFSFRKAEDLSIEILKSYVEELRIYRHKLQNLEIHIESQDIPKIQEYADALKNIYQSDAKKSIELERLSALALNALDDALEIKPNYPVGDDNQPTFTAPANKPDIECFYEKFNSVCEVTMLTNRSQWYNEGQPVMRHVRKFEETHSEKPVYCLFVAPRFHVDTVETFWVSVKYGYQGATQKIIPLSTSQFAGLLEILLEIRKQGKRFSHGEFLNLYEKVLDLTNHVPHSKEWVKKIPEVIIAWRKEILQNTSYEN